MRLLVSLEPSMIRFRRASLTLAALVALGGCSDIANMISPAGTADARPARVAFTASVAAATVQRADVVTLKVTSLYVQAGGAYYGIPDVDPWDETRDARLYQGPWPVVAHPPCAR